MSNKEDKEETAGHGLDDADKSSGNQKKVSPAANGKENPSLQTREEDEKQVSAPTLEGEEPDTESEHPDHLGEADNDPEDPDDSDDLEAAEDGDDAGAVEDSVGAADSDDPEVTVLRSGEESSDDQQFQVPEILPLAGAQSESPEQADEEETKDEDERVWGNQVGGHVDREEVPVAPAGSAFDVSQISVKKSESVKKTHSGSRRVVAWILGVIAVMALVGVGLYVSGISQRIFTSEGATSPKEGTKAYVEALLDKDAQSLCALFAPAAREEILGETAKKPEGNIMEQCTDFMKEQLARSSGNPTAKLEDFKYAPEPKADVGKVKTIVIKDKKDNPLQTLGWQQIDGRWFLAGNDLQQKVYMKYKQSLAARAQVSK